MSRERLEPDDTTTLEKKLHIVDESTPRKKPKMYKHPRSHLFDRIERFLPEMGKSEVQTAEERKTRQPDDVPSERNSDATSVEMTVDCGVFEILSPDLNEIGEESEKFRNVKEILDAQMDALTDAEMLQLIFAQTRPQSEHPVRMGEESERSSETSDNVQDINSSPGKIDPLIEKSIRPRKREGNQ